MIGPHGEKRPATSAMTFIDHLRSRPNTAVRTKFNNRVTPALAAGLADRPATLEQLVELIDERAPAVRYARTYRKRRPAA